MLNSCAQPCQTRVAAFLRLTHLELTAISGIEWAPSQEIEAENEAIKKQPQGVQPGEILIWDVTQQEKKKEKKEKTINGKCVIRLDKFNC